MALLEFGQNTLRVVRDLTQSLERDVRGVAHCSKVGRGEGAFNPVKYGVPALSLGERAVALARSLLFNRA